jgi:NAD(P)-dependent dehydrogenase (short-subunit alcohol dehydrogenase family)
MKSEYPQRLAERTALVTGAGSPVGHAVCERFAREGAWVVAVDGDAVAAEAAAEAARAAGGPAIGLRTEAFNPGVTDAIVATALERMWQIDVLVNNTTPLMGSAPHTGTDWAATMAINLEASYRFACAVLPQMRARHTGMIVNVAWLWGGGDDPDEVLARETSLAALTRLTGRLTTTHGGEGLRACVLCPLPGVNDTDAAVAGTGAANGARVRVDAQAAPERAAEWIATLAAGSTHAMAEV